MFRKCMAVFGVASLTAALGACGDASQSAGVESGVTVPSGELGTQALPRPDPNKLPDNPFDGFEVPKERYSRLASTIELERVRQGVPGISVGVMEKGMLTWSKGFGRKSALDTNSGQVLASTMFRSPVLGIGLTKMLALNMADKGEIALNDELSTYLPNLKLTYDPHGWFKQIAIRHLLTWSSGLPRTGERWYQFTPRDEGLAQWAQSELFSDLYLDFPPGRLVAGQAFAEPRLIALVAEEVTGMPFRKAIAERLLSPLGMNETTYLAEGVTQRSIATSAAPSKAQDAAAAAPVWGPYTNVADMAKYVRFYFRGNEAIFSDTMRDLAMYRVVHIGEFEAGCGEAFVWHTESPRCSSNTVPVPVVSMDVGTGGFKSAVYMTPDREFALIILSNANSWDALPVVKEAFRLASIAAPTWNEAKPMEPKIYSNALGSYVTAAPVASPMITISCAKWSDAHFGLVCPLVMQWKDGVNQRICTLDAMGNNTFRCNGLMPWKPGHGVPFPTVVNGPGQDIGEKFIPSGPETPIYGFEVWFDNGRNGELEYLVSAPMVGHVWAPEVTKPPYLPY